MRQSLYAAVGKRLPYVTLSCLNSRQSQMRAEQFRLTEKVESLTSLFNRPMDFSNSLRLCPLLPILRRPEPQYSWTVRARKGTESLKRQVHRCTTSKRLRDRTA